MKTITKEWLKEQGACAEGYKWFLKQRRRNPAAICRALIKEDHYDWAEWILVRVMTKPQAVAWAIFCAEQVLSIFEQQYPNDKRPREAIEAAKRVLASDTEETRSAAAESAWSASAAAESASAAWSAAAAVAAVAAAVARSAWSAAESASAAESEKEMRSRCYLEAVQILEAGK